eukprot:CAMPEP_0172594236 /NCGR_PEP_ID=MMETSP1068-20121228/13585_1 /TAXON_ID=35684 /ORGANISM="Pseudopedinella elastica, Strain CCMP716" /LENGTH=150 /DNA_ID=CAMNT_0013392155 /DNA_START=245 /DNA_END=697 /DNA_ORIENTATION=+
MRHGLELEVVSRRVLEEHGPLLARLSLEPKRWRDDEVDFVLLQPSRQTLKAFFAERKPKVRNRDLVAVDRVVEIRAAVVLSDPVANYLVALEGIVLPLCRAPALRESKHSAIKLFGDFKIMHGECKMERRSRSRHRLEHRLIFTAKSSEN